MLCNYAILLFCEVLNYLVNNTWSTVAFKSDWHEYIKLSNHDVSEKMSAYSRVSILAVPIFPSPTVAQYKYIAWKIHVHDYIIFHMTKMIKQSEVSN